VLHWGGRLGDREDRTIQYESLANRKCRARIEPRGPTKLSWIGDAAVDRRSSRRLPELDSVEYFLLLVGLIVMVAFSFVSAVYAFSVAWLMPIIFLALYMILRVLVPLRGAEPGVRDFRDQIIALEQRLDALQISLSATPVQYHIDNDQFYGNLTERVRNTACTRVDVTYFRKVPPSTFAQEKS